MDKNTFIMYQGYAPLFEFLSDDEAGKLIKAIFDYCFKNAEISLPDKLQGVFLLIQNQLNVDMEKYNKIVEKRRQAGQKGGRPSKEEEKQKKAKKANGFSEKQKKLNDNDNVNVNVNVNDNVNDSVYNDTICSGGQPPTPTSNEKKSYPNEKISFADNVSMTETEYQALIERYGKDDTEKLIDILDNYKGEKGKRYKSDYRAILNWCVKRLEEDKARERKIKENQNELFEDDFEHLRLEELTRK